MLKGGDILYQHQISIKIKLKTPKHSTKNESGLWIVALQCLIIQLLEPLPQPLQQEPRLELQQVHQIQPLQEP